MQNSWSDVAQGFLKDWNLRKDSMKTYTSNSHMWNSRGILDPSKGL